MSIHDDFTGPPLAVGEVHGLRVWRADKWGRLTGWTHREVWTPGENVAKCFRREVDEAWADVRPPKPNPCKGVEPDCNCGFWAYHDGVAEYGDDDGVVGVIRGYGRTVVGERGFRCEKAQIVAVAFPKCPCGCLECDPPHAQTRTVEMKVRRNYPEVAFFDSLDAMNAEFPVDPDLSPSPATDPDFWVRKESNVDELSRRLASLSRRMQSYARGGIIQHTTTPSAPTATYWTPPAPSRLPLRRRLGF